MVNRLYRVKIEQHAMRECREIRIPGQSLLCDFSTVLIHISEFLFLR